MGLGSHINVTLIYSGYFGNMQIPDTVFSKVSSIIYHFFLLEPYITPSKEFTGKWLWEQLRKSGWGFSPVYSESP